MIRLYSAYGMFNRYHHVYQINQENMQKSLFYFHEISDPLPFLPAIILECVGILKIFCSLALAIRFTYCTDTTCTTLEAPNQRSWNQKNRRIRPKPSMILLLLLHKCVLLKDNNAVSLTGVTALLSLSKTHLS